MSDALPSAQRPVEGFAVETGDGLIFTVKGMLHPPRGTVAYLRYVPDPAGDRLRAGRRYRRVYALAEQVAELRARGLAYVAGDSALGPHMHVVPDSAVRVVYDPRACLARLAAGGEGDDPSAAAAGGEDDDPSAAAACGAGGDDPGAAAAALCRLLAAAAGVPREALGVTGSLLFGLQNADSDLDIVVYGAEECKAVHGALRRLMHGAGSPLRPPTATELAAIAARHREDTPISDTDFARLQARKVNEGRFYGRAFFVRFVRRPDELRERYGDPRYEPLGTATVRGTVAEASEALFTPCRYVVAEVTCEDGPGAAVTEVVSFRGRFTDQAERGELLRARGTVERVVWRAGPSGVRLVVGAPGDFLVSARSRLVTPYPTQ